MPRTRIIKDIEDMPVQRRSWIIEARKAHTPTYEQAVRLVEAEADRKRKPVHNGVKGHLIEQRRLRQGLSQEDLAALVECSQNEISKIELGERIRMDPYIVDRLAKELHTTREAIQFGGAQTKTIRILGEMMSSETVRPYETERHLEHNSIIVSDGFEGYLISEEGLPWEQGATVVCLTDGSSLEECYGHFCVAVVEGVKHIKRVERGDAPGLVHLRPYKSGNALLTNVRPTWISRIRSIILP